MWVSMPVMSDSDCQSLYEGTQWENLFNKDMVCAGDGVTTDNGPCKVCGCLSRRIRVIINLTVCLGRFGRWVGVWGHIGGSGIMGGVGVWQP